MSSKSGFIEIEGVEGCDNWRWIDMLDPKYDERTRFIKTLGVFTDYGLSDYYHNRIDTDESGSFYILVKMAPYATKCFNDFGGDNIQDYYGNIVGILNDLKNLEQVKQTYLKQVLTSSEANEYDIMFAINVVLHECVMWSEYDTDAIRHNVGPYFIKFFEDNKKYIINESDWKQWNENNKDKSRWINDLFFYNEKLFVKEFNSSFLQKKAIDKVRGFR